MAQTNFSAEKIPSKVIGENCQVLLTLPTDNGQAPYELDMIPQVGETVVRTFPTVGNWLVIGLPIVPFTFVVKDNNGMMAAPYEFMPLITTASGVKEVTGVITY